MKYFNEQKQEIIDYIEELKTYSGGEILEIIEEPRKLMSLIRDLQPPKLTCGTCKTKQFDRVGELGYCSNYSSPLAGITMTDKIANGVSCILHSEILKDGE